MLRDIWDGVELHTFGLKSTAAMSCFEYALKKSMLWSCADRYVHAEDSVEVLAASDDFSNLRSQQLSALL